MIEYQSLIERDCVCLLDFDKEVTSIEAQPFTIPFVDQNGKKRRYTPDYLCVRNGRSVLIECKPASKVEHEHTKRQIYAGRLWCANNDAEFELVTDEQLRDGYLLKNVKLLMQYARHIVNENTQERLLEALEESPLPMWELMELVAPTYPERLRLPILHMVYHHKLTMPLNSEFIDDDSEVRVSS